ncbi:MAG: succinate dehydrogenase assembly factor 2 [Pseudomonadota bacterium]
MTSKGETDHAGWREDVIDPTQETQETRLRRLKIRCWRRGTKEMDLILGGFLDARGADLASDELAAFERLLRENDTDLYRWVSDPSARDIPADHGPIIETIRAHHGMA